MDDSRQRIQCPLDAGPDGADSLFVAAAQHAEAGDFAAAVQLLDRARVAGAPSTRTARGLVLRLAHKPQSAIAVLAAAYEDGEPFAAVALADALLSTGHTREARDALTAAADCHDDALACVALAQLVEETQERSGWLERAELLGGLGEETLPKWTKKRALVWITLDDLRPPPTTPKGHDTL